ncbi:hypothetical protein LPA44_13700 [Halobacterium sp. KA-4]|uniref:helix-turn-helix transcriptional regulator n=1 Tax=Halobacterium sp. KA-4 TaxID=2896367 RepID=UPI001E6425A6|nr:hypothetical protein [Halobacterium sp. KA-4]MCD2200939.1 hypothetical protein [Halobacterium sp. KA-4]
MVETEDGTELRSILHKRHNVLAALKTEPQTKPDLVETIDSSRSTIDRAISSLEDTSCIERQGETYHLTQLGRVSFAEHNRYVKIMDGIARASGILNSISREICIDPDFFSGVSVQTADPHAPESALKNSIKALKTSDRLVCLIPVVLSVYIEVLTNHICKHEIEAELLFHNNALESLLEYYHDRFDKIDTNEHVELYVTEQDLPYALWITEHDGRSRVDITVYEDGGVRGVLMNDSSPALQWALKEFAKYLEASERATIYLT